MSGGIPIIFIMIIILVVGDVIMPLASHRYKDETKVGVKEEGRDGCREEGDKGTVGWARREHPSDQGRI